MYTLKLTYTTGFGFWFEKVANLTPILGVNVQFVNFKGVAQPPGSEGVQFHVFASDWRKERINLTKQHTVYISCYET